MSAAAALVLMVVMAAVDSGASAQQLWSVESVTTRLDAPTGPRGVASSAMTVDGLNSPPTRVAEIRVEFDFLRLGMGYLELPLADGTVIEAENAVFENRGGGNVMWTGEVPGAGYESVLFTVQDGHLVGWFGEPGGPKYTVHAGPDGRGTVAVEQGPTGDWCGVEEAPLRARSAARSVAPAADQALSFVAPGSSDVTLDVLLLYTSRTEEYWRQQAGSVEAGVRQLEDYLNMVLRNGEIPGRANLICERWEPEALIRPPLDSLVLVSGEWEEDLRDIAGLHRTLTAELPLWDSGSWHWEFAANAEVADLRDHYGADTVFFMVMVGHGRTGGAAHLRTSAEPWSLSLAWGHPFGGALAHEIGHNLGGHHEPVTFGSSFPQVQRESLRPYGFGHTDLTSCAEREGYGRSLFCPTTSMSYSQDTWDDPERFAVIEPFYSSVRHKPNGWTIGVSGTSEVERLLHETVPIAARDSEVPRREEQYPRRIEANWSGRDRIRLTWAERWSAEAFWRVRLALVGGSNLVEGSNHVWDEDSRNVTPILDAGLVAGAELNVARLRPADAYRISVIGPWAWGSVRPLASDSVLLRPAGTAGAAPAAPVRVAAEAMGVDGVRLTWRGGSPAAESFQVACRGWESRWAPEDWRLCADRLPGGARAAEVRGLKAEEEIQVTEGYSDHVQSAWRDGEKARVARYDFAVAAHNDRGYAAETVRYEFMPGPPPPPTAAGEVSDCVTRVSDLNLDGHEIYVCFETPDGTRRRAWDYGLDSERSGLLYFFGRDNAEVLVKILDGCAVNGHRWIFVAPVTTLSFRLVIFDPGPPVPDKRQSWHYDSKRRPQDQLGDGFVEHWGYDDEGAWAVVRREWIGNPRGDTARTVSDTTAFPCTTAEVAAAKARAADATGGHAAFLRSRGVTGELAASARRLAAGARTDCEPGAAALTLAGGYKVSMCYETYAGETGAALDYGLDSSQSGLLYFFERDNAEALIKVLDGCGVNGHRWVFVAPVTDLAFNLRVESPDGQRWTHANRLGQTADAASDVAAFACA